MSGMAYNTAGCAWEEKQETRNSTKRTQHSKEKEAAWRACRGPEANMHCIFTQRTLAGYYLYPLSVSSRHGTLTSKNITRHGRHNPHPRTTRTEQGTRYVGVRRQRRKGVSHDKKATRCCARHARRADLVEDVRDMLYNTGV